MSLNGDETQIVVNLSFSGLTSAAIAAHIHGAAAAGANAGVLFDFSGVTPSATSGTIPAQSYAISAAQVAQLKAGQFYFNIHTASFSGGEIRGQITLAPIQKFTASFTGAQEVPPSGSPGTGSGTVLLNGTEDQITVMTTFANLTSNANMAHIHGPAPPGVDGGIVFPLSGVPAETSGIIPDQDFAITALQVADLKAGLHYFNIHTTGFGDGEIRGQIGAVPMLTVAKGGSGTSSAFVTSSPAGIICGGDCAEAYFSGTSVTLTAGAAAAGSFFAGWIGGGCAGTGRVHLYAGLRYYGDGRLHAVIHRVLFQRRSARRGADGRQSSPHRRAAKRRRDAARQQPARAVRLHRRLAARGNDGQGGAHHRAANRD